MTQTHWWIGLVFVGGWFALAVIIGLATERLTRRR